MRSNDPAVAAQALRELVVAGGADLPLPGAGQTRRRFDALAAVGERDLTVGRLLEAHADAVAIMAELAPRDTFGEPDSVWAVWAAEGPATPVWATESPDGWRVSGRKSWCSGAGHSTFALITAKASDGGRLFAVDLRQPEASPVDDAWPAPALSGTDTRSVDFDNARATAIGGVGDYLGRPGFWHGAVGVAAVWFGGSVAVGRRLLDSAGRRELDPVDQASLGAVAASLSAARSALASAADQIDDDPYDGKHRAAIIARSTRAVVEASAVEVIDRVGRALGPGPLAMDGKHARLVSDLQLYLRQSHADRDLADLGRRVTEAGDFW
jgi:alkylation response protein AidB-like acyl-CoA dehydrogenase